MADVAEIIDELGGATAISNETGIPLTTVHSWKRSRFVPRWRVASLVALAERLGKPFGESDFPRQRPAMENIEHAGENDPLSTRLSSGNTHDVSAEVAQ